MSKQKRVQIIRSEHGSLERIVDVSKQEIRDLWHIAQTIKGTYPDASEQILDVWHLAHELRFALLSVAHGADITEPLHTK